MVVTTEQSRGVRILGLRLVITSGGQFLGTRSAAVSVAVSCSEEGEVQSLWKGGKTSSFSPDESTDRARQQNLKADHRRRRNGRESQHERHTVWRFAAQTAVSCLTLGFSSTQGLLSIYRTKSDGISSCVR